MKLQIPSRWEAPWVRVAMVALGLSLLALLAAACQTTLRAQDQWTPPYLQVRICGGQAQIRQQEGSGWTTVANGANLVIQETYQIVADPAQGVQLCFGDDTVMELAGGTEADMQDLGVFPRLSTTLKQGSLRFTVQESSYEFIVPGCTTRRLGLPARASIEVSGLTARVAVEEGSVQCVGEEQTITLQPCNEMIVSADGSAEVRDFCSGATPVPTPTGTATPAPAAVDTAVPETPTATETASPSPEPPAASGGAPTATPSVTPTGTATPTPTSTPTPTPSASPTVGTVWPTATPTPLPTATQAPPPTKKPTAPPPPTPVPPTPVPPTPVPPTPVPPTPVPPTPVPPPTVRPTAPAGG